jgi:hypothetical protein
MENHDRVLIFSMIDYIFIKEKYDIRSRSSLGLLRVLGTRRSEKIDKSRPIEISMENHDRVLIFSIIDYIFIKEKYDIRSIFFFS